MCLLEYMIRIEKIKKGGFGSTQALTANLLEIKRRDEQLCCDLFITHRSLLASYSDTVKTNYPHRQVTDLMLSFRHRNCSNILVGQLINSGGRGNRTPRPNILSPADHQYRLCGSCWIRTNGLLLVGQTLLNQLS